ncbi:hypothetical protein CHS0354_016178 [Potamilus streckersoni]|uniref:Endoglucanase n=1 Tax=Potamilus streckersoni TaxID=2493646 RepID=A0AAE0RXW4_9BIVA|nr:hypothetical protein CHS0354_016178 [Potamilus streckersoni]
MKGTGKGTVLSHSADSRVHTLVNTENSLILNPGQTLDLKVEGTYTGSSAPTATAQLINLGHDPYTLPPALPSHDGTKYNYDEVLMKSILFYEAQRSGKLPTDNRIPWRGDSAINDTGDNGEDLTGGWYDAGDHVKFNLPMAASTTVLTWGLIAYMEAYQDSGQLDHMYSCIKWPLDYLLKCHVSKFEFYVQVGKAELDHNYWGRPENMTMPRPAYKITAQKPGSDIAAETAAAFAAGYLAYHNTNKTYANILLMHARDLYEFAISYQGKYSDSVPEAKGFYQSYDAQDELCWGGAWMYLATREQKYLTEAEKHYEPGAAWGQSWDEKNTGCMVMLYKVTRKDIYKTDIESTFKSWMPGGTIPYTPRGLAYRLTWGSLRYASNMAMLALMAADEGIHPTEYRHWAQSQIHYALGDTGHSYVVGFGVNSPTQPHHRSSSCPLVPAPCSNRELQQTGPNTHILYGALVGGPDQSDHYEDRRDDYVKNEVACDYNSGFQTAVAGKMM